MDIETRMREVEREIISRRPEHSVDLALDRMADLVGLLGDPQRACPVIHITGTNGKTSTARMSDTLLRGRGLRTGRFTSPHLVSIRERIVIDGAPISPERFVAAYDEVIPYVNLVDERHPSAMSFFEVLTGMAFAVFADTPVDVMILEVGVGGRLDCTNVADGVVAVITPISLDHTRLLGSTVEEIAGEKAGIIKPGAVAVLAQQPLGAAEVLLRYAVEVGATVAREGVEFGVLSRERAVGGQHLALRGLRGTYEDVYLPLFGLHQAGNAACALAAVEAFAGVSDDGAPLDADLVRESFAKVSSPGRMEIVRRSPTIIIDAAHNPAGMAATVAAVQEAFSFARLSGVFAASGDKDVPGILAELEPLLTDIVVTRNSSDRSLDPEQTAELAVEIFGEDRVQSAERLDDAIEIAVALADEAVAETGPGSGGVLITGSVITAGDARRLLAPAGGELPAEPPASQPSRHSFTAAELS
ncbi:MAG TPA: folylpolyglutamate synthase/dihydrofolate synthase family protein [Streptosporangiaceae bacterium]|nr:folylpolyglutamate synthase/dihydrofolate synthase family protein [Streptosporangiaceae bacterium]